MRGGKREGAGRPKADAPKKSYVMIYMSEELREAIAKAAEQDGRKISDMARRALEKEFLKNRK